MSSTNPAVHAASVAAGVDALPAAVTLERLREIASGVASALHHAEEAASQFTRDEDAVEVDQVVAQLKSVSELLRSAGL